jgi:hypothetical protein
MRALSPRFLDLTHFGRFDNADRHLAELGERLDEWVEWVRVRLDAGKSRDEVVAELAEKNVADVIRDAGDSSLATAYELATPSGMTVDGISRYLTQRYPRPSSL